MEVRSNHMSLMITFRYEKLSFLAVKAKAITVEVVLSIKILK